MSVSKPRAAVLIARKQRRYKKAKRAHDLAAPGFCVVCNQHGCSKGHKERNRFPGEESYEEIEARFSAEGKASREAKEAKELKEEEAREIAEKKAAESALHKEMLSALDAVVDKFEKVLSDNIKAEQKRANAAQGYKGSA